MEKHINPTKELQKVFDELSDYVTCELVERGKPSVRVIKVYPRYRKNPFLIVGVPEDESENDIYCHLRTLIESDIGRKIDNYEI